MPGNDAVALQLEITMRIPDGCMVTQQLLDEMVREWAEDGETQPGVDIKIIDWKRAGGRSTKARDQDEARTRFRGLLQQGRFTVRLRGDSQVRK